MVKGGYQIIDLEDRNFTKLSNQTYKGIYEKLDNTRKPCILSGIKLNGIELRDVFVNFTKSGNQYTCHFECVIENKNATVIVTVGNTDNVLITW